MQAYKHISDTLNQFTKQCDSHLKAFDKWPTYTHDDAHKTNTSEHDHNLTVLHTHTDTHLPSTIASSCPSQWGVTVNLFRKCVREMWCSDGSSSSRSTSSSRSNRPVPSSRIDTYAPEWNRCAWTVAECHQSIILARRDAQRARELVEWTCYGCRSDAGVKGESVTATLYAIPTQSNSDELWMT